MCPAGQTRACAGESATPPGTPPLHSPKSRAPSDEPCALLHIATISGVLAVPHALLQVVPLLLLVMLGLHPAPQAVTLVERLLLARCRQDVLRASGLIHWGLAHARPSCVLRFHAPVCSSGGVLRRASLASLPLLGEAIGSIPLGTWSVDSHLVRRENNGSQQVTFADLPAAFTCCSS